MIAKRNKFRESNWSVFGATKSLQQFFASKLIELMTELDFNERDVVERTPLIDFLTIKEIFRYTLKWKNPKIQALILEKVEEERHRHILSTEYLNLKQSIVCELVDVDDVAVTQTVLSAVQNQNIYLYRDHEKYNPLGKGALMAEGYNAIQTIFEYITVCSLKFHFIVSFLIHVPHRTFSFKRTLRSNVVLFWRLTILDLRALPRMFH